MRDYTKGRAMPGERKTDRVQPTTCQIRIKGHLSHRWADWFAASPSRLTITATGCWLALWPTRPRYTQCSGKYVTWGCPWSPSILLCLIAWKA